MHLAAILLLLALGVPGHPAFAEESTPPDEGGFVESMGQPNRFFPYVGLSAGAYRPNDDIEPTGRLTLGVFGNLLSPVAAIGPAVEGYVGARGNLIDGGIRGLLMLRPLRLGFGIDYNIRDNEPDFLLSFIHPIRRGGPFGFGGRLRLDYLPTRGHSFQVGFVVPFGQKWMGRTRPPSDHVSIFVPKEEPALSPSDDPDLQAALANVRDAADWINRFTTPFFDSAGGSRGETEERFVARVGRFKRHIAERSDLYPEGRTYPAEIRVYHAELDRAFSIASAHGSAGRNPGETTSLGREVSAQAREVLLDEVVLPYNRMLGRIKKPDTTVGFAARARDAFDLWLARESRVSSASRPALRHVFQNLLDAIEEAREGSSRYWETSELVWIPIHLAKRPDELETQEELDALIERAVEEDFTEGNDHYYVINEQFQWELVRHIREAEDYHVLWIHDFRGTGNDKLADQIGFEQVHRGYLETLTRRVREYDRTGKLPTYMIFLDQIFYEPNNGRIWMSLLEDPLHAKVKLPGGEKAREMEATIAQAQEELREAVASSTLLQQRARTYGDDWLRNRIKVHVNITNPIDWSFWSQRVIPLLGLPDVIMRDHRKISFFDVTETDPAKGEAIFTGMGVGDHYAGPTWEDRAILVRGPALLPLKAAAREMLIDQGFPEDEVPYPLRPLPKPNDYAELIARRAEKGFDMRAMQLHNETGYGPKPINVAKAVLYDIMPSDSFLVVPDSLWNSPFWAGMLTGNAMRGGNVFLVAPSLDNAPSAGFPQMSRAQEIFAQMIVVQEMLGDELKAAGGSLHTGIYDVDVDVGDLAGRVAHYYDKLPSSPVLEAWVGLSPDEDPEAWEEHMASVRRNKARILSTLAELGFEPGYLVEDKEERKPKLHLKAQIFLNRSGMNIFKSLDWAVILEREARQRVRQIQATEYVDLRETWAESSRLWDEQAERARAATSPEDRAKGAGYLTVGSHNMDYRGMMMDGEVLYITAGRGIVSGLRDIFHVAGMCIWIDDLEELTELIPEYSEWQRRVGRFMKYAL